MKKRLLFTFLVLATAFYSPAQNLIKDGGFDSGIFEQNTGDPDNANNGGSRGVWYYKTHANTNVDIVDMEGERGNVISIERTGTLSWFTSFIAQWIDGAATREYYKLTFKAKRESGEGMLRTHIKAVGSQHFFILKDGENIDYSAQKDIPLTNEWQTYEIEYDFNTVVNTTYSSNKEFLPATDEQLSSFFITLYPHANNTKILIDDVKLEPLKTFEPAPDEGELLWNTDFESVNDIPRRTILNTDKFSEVMGEWYFYAEPGLNGIDESTAEIKEEGGTRGKVASLKNGNTVPSWWGHTFMQRLAAKPQQNIYRVSFYAKSNAQAKAFVMINTKRPEDSKAEYILKEGFDPVATPKSSGARHEITTSANWQYYECTFDFTQKCNNYNSPEGVGEAYAITPTDDDFLRYCYLAIFNNTGSSELLIDNINIEEIDTYTEMQNTGFEDNNALPIKLTSDLSLGSHSGQWVLVAKNEDKGDVFVTSDQAKSGEKSMQVEVEELTNRARYSFYLVMDIYEVEAKDYIFRFHSKASLADVPFRLDAYVYNGESAQAITGNNGEILTSEGVETSAAGLKMFNTNTDWTEYQQRMTIPENSMIRIFIRPNITGLGAAGPQADSYPMTYWFDDFSLEEATTDNIKDISGNNLKVTSHKGALQISNLENNDLLIYSLNGILIRQLENVSGEITCPLSQGAYIIECNSPIGKTDRIKVLVE